MKIVYVSDAIYPYNKGGKEKRLYELSTRLAQLGHDVHIYTMHWWYGPETERVEDGVTLHALCKYYPLYKQDGDRRSIKEALLFSLACLKLVDVDFDVLDVDHMPFFPIYSAWLVCVLRGRRSQFYGTWHEALSRKDWTDYMGPAGNIAAAVERVSVHMPRVVTAASKHTQLLIKSELRRTKRVRLVTSGIDVAAIDAIQPADIDCDVLYSGRLVKDKNVDKLVQAMAIVHKQAAHVRCTIVGHGIEKPHIASLIRKLKLDKVITLRDPLPESSDVYAYMKASKVYCLPSIREGFGIVCLEALACGTPVVTTDAPANAAKDLIEAGINGSVVELEPANLAEALLDWTGRDKPKHIKGKVQDYDWNWLARTQAEVYTV